MKNDLDDMSVKDLRDLRKKVDKAIASFEDRKRKEAIAEVEATAAKHGFSLSELTGAGKPKKKRATVAPKYANPKNRAETWSGRGRRPRWVVAALATGKTMDDFRI